MFDATKLLGNVLQGRSERGGGGLGGLIGNLTGGTGGGAGGVGGLLQQVAAQFGGGGSGGGHASVPGGTAVSGQGGGFMADVAALTRRAMADPAAELRGNNPAAIGGLGALAGAVMGGGRGALGGGLLAVLGSIAYRAYEDGNGQGGTGAAATATPPPSYADEADVQRKAALVLRAMVQAMKADGQFDDGERARLAAHLGPDGEDAEAKGFLDAEMARPVDVDALAAEARSPTEAAELYAASLAAISVDTQVERDYLARLAAALRLPNTVTARIGTSVSGAA